MLTPIVNKLHIKILYQFFRQALQLFTQIIIKQRFKYQNIIFFKIQSYSKTSTKNAKLSFMIYAICFLLSKAIQIEIFLFPLQSIPKL